MKTNYYEVAGHQFSVTAEESDFALMTNYEVFKAIPCDPVFVLNIGKGDCVDYTAEMRQKEEEQEIVCGKNLDGEPVFEFTWKKVTAGWLVCSTDYREARLVATGSSFKMAIDNALMILFSMATAEKGTALFHSAVVSLKGRGYMFLGKSGTGKSTHASLWVKNVKGAELVNDDNPVVRVMDDGRAVVFGSPWSGKTPCYRNVSYPLGGIVQLSQAPYNKIRRLGGIEAYVSLVSSISGKRWERRIADGLHYTENTLASTVPIWHLECLPNAEAAELCQSTLSF